MNLGSSQGGHAHFLQCFHFCRSSGGCGYLLPVCLRFCQWLQTRPHPLTVVLLVMLPALLQSQQAPPIAVPLHTHPKQFQLLNFGPAHLGLIWEGCKLLLAKDRHCSEHTTSVATSSSASMAISGSTKENDWQSSFQGSCSY